MGARRWREGLALWGRLAGQGVFTLCWILVSSMLSLCVIFPVICLARVIGRVWPGGKRGLLRGLETFEILGLRKARWRWGRDSALRVARRPDLTPFARAAGCNPAALLATMLLTDESNDVEKLSRLVLSAEFWPAESSSRANQWLEQLKPLCQSWDRPCGRLDWMWGLSAKRSAREEARRLWNSLGAQEGFDELDRGMRVSAERASLEASTQAALALQKTRGRL